jgi:hypothetical protein
MECRSRFDHSIRFNLTTSYLSVGKMPMNDQNSNILYDFKASYAFVLKYKSNSLQV